MGNLRFEAIKALSAKEQDIRSYNDRKVTDLFASNVFTQKAQREYLSDEAYKSLINSVKTGSKIDRKMAEQIANGMKAWAMEKGVTHFT
ncbi:MAG TPA: glutamine synthetase III, partial [Chitinophagaceae bacterium]|nr:glutamine synthetase III [Chitinophagaceae bacterium]